MVFPWFSQEFNNILMIFPWFSRDFPMFPIPPFSPSPLCAFPVVRPQGEPCRVAGEAQAGRMDGRELHLKGRRKMGGGKHIHCI
jgi:hypothetical protein